MIVKEPNDKKREVDELAKMILRQLKNLLVVELRFMDMAMSRLQWKAQDTILFGTDGRQIYYVSENILQLYKNDVRSVPRYYLHSVLHCIFRHMFVSPEISRRHWDIACDIAVENVINELGQNSFSSGKKDSQEKYISHLRKEIKAMTAE